MTTATSLSTHATVAFARCADYDAARLAAALERLLDALGGWEHFVRPGLRVLVKPNLLTDRPPDAAVTTHPALLRAVVRRLKALGAQVAVGDSPASAVRLAQVWERTGTAAVCAEEAVPLLSFEAAGARAVTRDGETFLIAAPVLDADLLINLPKVKTHTLTTLTAAVKNLYGTLPGYQKMERHKSHPHPAAFGAALRKLHACLPPMLCIADGVVGMEGDGPSGGTPVTLGFLAASSDAVALDLALCAALAIPTRRVPYLADAAAWPPPRRVGDDPAAWKLPPLRLPKPSATRLIPAPLARLAGRAVWIRPRFNAACTACGRCVQTCPMQALTLGAANPPPRLDGARCIGCCCCHEVCPARAIAMRQSPLLRLCGAFEGL